MRDGEPRSFLQAFFAAFLFGVVGLVSFNVVIDPFRIFDLVSIPGLNEQRTQVSSRGRMAKAVKTCLVDATSVVMGTSRVEVGANPDHPGWHNRGRVYSLALAGMGIGELEQTFRHLVNASPNVKEVAIGIDFLMFNANREAVVFGTEVGDFDPKRLLLEAGQSCLNTYAYNLNDIVGPGALPYSWRTVQQQMPEPGSAGFKTESVPLWVAQYDHNGYRGKYFDVVLLLAKKNGFRGQIDGGKGDSAGQESAYVRKIWRPLPEERYCLTAPGQPNTLDVFGDLLDVAQKSGVRVHIFINPIHARMLIALREAGLWPVYEDWKRGLVRVNDEVARKHGREPLPIWDFSGFNTVTTERVPELGDLKTPMLYYWEPSHYREAAGTLALDRMLDYRDPGGRTVPDDYGVLLTSQSIDGWIERTRSAALAYMRDQPHEHAIVKAAVDRVMHGAPGANCGYDVAAVKAGSKLLKAGDKAGADAEFARAIELRDEDMARYAALGVPYREAALDTMIAQARAGVTFEPALASWGEYNRRANRRAAKGDLVGALADLDAAIRFAPPTAVLHQTRGSLRMQVGDLDGARKDFNGALKLKPGSKQILDSVEALNRKVAAASSAKATVADVKAGDDLAPAEKSWRQYNQRATRRVADNDLAGALVDFDTAIRLGPPLAVLHQSRGSIRMKLGDLEGAMEDFEKGLEIEPENKRILGFVKLLESVPQAADGSN
jgi:Flp pilus assembly protein TadD